MVIQLVLKLSLKLCYPLIEQELASPKCNLALSAHIFKAEAVEEYAVAVELIQVQVDLPHLNSAEVSQQEMEVQPLIIS